jgi:hypothetical protein
MQPLVSVIIPTRDRKEKLLRLLASVRVSEYPVDRMEIIVVDNASSDKTAEVVSSAFPDVQVVRSETNLYCAGGRNLGADAAKGAYVFFVDDDNILDPACISRLVAAMEGDKRIGIAAPLMLHHRRLGVIWCAGGMIDWWGRVSYRFGGRAMEHVRLPAMLEADFFPNAYMVRSRILQEGLRHRAELFPHNWSEPDLCARVRKAGSSVMTITSAVTRHDIDYASFSLTRVGIDKTFDQARARIRYRRIYMNDALRWLAFFMVVLPYSTVAYLCAFATQKDASFAALIKAYLQGTMEGFCGRL